MSATNFDADDVVISWYKGERLFVMHTAGVGMHVNGTTGCVIVEEDGSTPYKEYHEKITLTRLMEILGELDGEFN